LITLPYSFSRIQKSESLVDEIIIGWVKKLDELFATTDEAFDMAQWATYAAFDVISLVGFGEAFGFVEIATDVNDLIKELHRGFFYFRIVGRLYPFVEFIKRTPLGKFLVSGSAGQALTEDHIRAECMLLFTASADTTGTTMGAMINYMLSSPVVYGKMFAEIDSAFESGVLSKPIPTSIEVSKNCPYYVACVKESLRLCPSAPNIFPRLVQADHAPLVIDGKTIPVGTEIASTAYMANQDTELYGEDVNEFRPDHWLEDDGEKGKLFDKYLAAFGFGTHGCLGKELAMMELMKTPLIVSSPPFFTFGFVLCSSS
jgi:cytochrome P450